MPRVDHTKDLIAKGLIELMEQTKFDAVSVTAIISRCGVSRHTFYYHFQDKYDLAQWIFLKLSSKYFPIPSRADVENGRHFYIRSVIDHMYKYRGFYTNLFNSSANQLLYEKLYDHIVRYRNVQIDALLNGRSLSGDGRKFVTNYYTCAITGMIMRWAKAGMVDPIEVFFQDYQDVALQSMEALVNRYAR